MQLLTFCLVLLCATRRNEFFDLVFKIVTTISEKFSNGITVSVYH